jgi:hypothetical protein
MCSSTTPSIFASFSTMKIIKNNFHLRRENAYTIYALCENHASVEGIQKIRDFVCQNYFDSSKSFVSSNSSQLNINALEFFPTYVFIEGWEGVLSEELKKLIQNKYHFPQEFQILGWDSNRCLYHTPHENEFFYYLKKTESILNNFSQVFCSSFECIHLLTTQFSFLMKNLTDWEFYNLHFEVQKNRVFKYINSYIESYSKCSSFERHQRLKKIFFLYFSYMMSIQDAFIYLNMPKRNEAMIKNIQKYAPLGSRVFIIAGSSHFIFKPCNHYLGYKMNWLSQKIIQKFLKKHHFMILEPFMNHSEILIPPKLSDCHHTWEYFVYLSHKIENFSCPCQNKDNLTQ